MRAGWPRPSWPAWLIEVNLSCLCRLFAASPTLTLLSMTSARQWHESAAGRQAPGLLKHRNTSLAPYLFFPSSPPQQIEKPAGQTEFPNSRDHHVFPHAAHARSPATHTHPEWSDPLLMERESGGPAKLWYLGVQQRRGNCPGFSQFTLEKLLKLENSPSGKHAEALRCIFDGR